jgi:hypothetical protein
VETIWLQTLYVLFFIHLSTRRVVLVGVTANPDSRWVTQQARNVEMDLEDRGLPIRFLLRDRDAKFTRSFHEVFCTEGAKIIRIPIQVLRGGLIRDGAALPLVMRAGGLGGMAVGVIVPEHGEAFPGSDWGRPGLRGRGQDLRSGYTFAVRRCGANRI